MSTHHHGLRDDDSERSEPQGDTLHRALDYLNDELGKRLTLVERLPGKSGAWAVDSLHGEHGILKVFKDSSCSHIA